MDWFDNVLKVHICKFSNQLFLEKPCQLHISVYQLNYWSTYHSYWPLCVHLWKILCWVGLGTIDIDDMSVIRISRSLVNGFTCWLWQLFKEPSACVRGHVCGHGRLRVRLRLCVCCKLFCGSSKNLVSFFYIHVCYVTERALTGTTCYLATTYLSNFWI
jgi:hypothetical protein